MTDQTEHLEALLSRRPDGNLTVAEEAQIRRAVGEDRQAAASAEEYDRLNRLLSAYRMLPGNMDWHGFSREVTLRIDEALAAGASAELDRAIDPSAIGAEAESDPAVTGPRMNAVAREYEAVEERLQDWATPLPDVDWDAFKTRVSAAVRQEAAASRPVAATHPWPAAARWFAPLAAAAAIAIVFWWPRGALNLGPDVGESKAPLVLVSLEVPMTTGTVTIAFDQGPPAETPTALAGAGSAAIAIGPGRVESVETYDAAYFY